MLRVNLLCLMRRSWIWRWRLIVLHSWLLVWFPLDEFELQMITSPTPSKHFLNILEPLQVISAYLVQSRHIEAEDLFDSLLECIGRMGYVSERLRCSLHMCHAMILHQKGGQQLNLNCEIVDGCSHIQDDSMDRASLMFSCVAQVCLQSFFTKRIPQILASVHLPISISHWSTSTVLKKPKNGMTVLLHCLRPILWQRWLLLLDFLRGKTFMKQSWVCDVVLLFTILEFHWHLHSNISPPHYSPTTTIK